MNEWKYIYDQMTPKERKEQLTAMGRRLELRRKVGSASIPLSLTPRLKLILTVSMAAVSVVSWMAVRVAPYALYVIPLFAIYCGAIVLIRGRVKTAHYVGQ